jgi:hypothetical protein
MGVWRRDIIRIRIRETGVVRLEKLGNGYLSFRGSRLGESALWSFEAIRLRILSKDVQGRVLEGTSVEQ